MNDTVITSLHRILLNILWTDCERKRRMSWPLANTRYSPRGPHPIHITVRIGRSEISRGTKASRLPSVGHNSCVHSKLSSPAVASKEQQQATAAIKPSASTGGSPNSVSNSRVLLLSDPELRRPQHQARPPSRVTEMVSAPPPHGSDLRRV